MNRHECRTIHRYLDAANLKLTPGIVHKLSKYGNRDPKPNKMYWVSRHDISVAGLASERRHPDHLGYNRLRTKLEIADVYTNPYCSFKHSQFLAHFDGRGLVFKGEFEVCVAKGSFIRKGDILKLSVRYPGFVTSTPKSDTYSPFATAITATYDKCKPNRFGYPRIGNGSTVFVKARFNLHSYFAF